MVDLEAVLQCGALVFGAVSAILWIASARVTFPEPTGKENWGHVTDSVGPSEDDLQMKFAVKRQSDLGAIAAMAALAAIIFQLAALAVHLKWVRFLSGT